MAQHLLAAADRFEIPRLRAICEKHLCETVDVANAATTLTLAEENHATVRMPFFLLPSISYLVFIRN